MHRFSGDLSPSEFRSSEISSVEFKTVLSAYSAGLAVQLDSKIPTELWKWMDTQRKAGNELLASHTTPM